MTTAFGAKVPPYSTVLDLDRKVRDFPVPWRLRIKCGLTEDSEPTKATHMQRWFVMSCKEASRSCAAVSKSRRLISPSSTFELA